MAYRDPDDLNVRRERGAPPTRMASPMTTSWGPLETNPLGDIIGIPEPTDSTGSVPTSRIGKKSKR
jgi:hypothetical protein